METGEALVVVSGPPHHEEDRDGDSSERADACSIWTKTYARASRWIGLPRNASLTPGNAPDLPPSPRRSAQ